MGQTLEVVKQLETNAFKLIQKCNNLSENLKIAKIERAKSENQNRQLKRQIEKLLTENDELKTANAILGSKDYKRETKLKINRLIREVDSCIVQLSE